MNFWPALLTIVLANVVRDFLVGDDDESETQ